jgi:D-glucosaminate-6-phosphate ammonia-lyase
LCGRQELIMSAALQHQDMDVFPETWPRKHFIASGAVAGPPHHGIGRGFKVGKEEIVGLITALTLYPKRDFEAELKVWMEDMQSIATRLDGTAGVEASVIFPQPNGRPCPNVYLKVDPSVAKVTAEDVINQLQEGTPSISVFEKHAASGTVVIMPEALQPGEATVIADRLKAIFGSSPDETKTS